MNLRIDGYYESGFGNARGCFFMRNMLLDLWGFLWYNVVIEISMRLRARL
ncbi:MAG: hypothetical protein K2N72_11380 [Oscillospiraceae bacterium]|nr:hypothetical protein [Oscillospiraceae bacterium]